MTSAHYLLSDLYISDDIHNQEVLCNGSSDDSDYDDDQVRKYRFHSYSLITLAVSGAGTGTETWTNGLYGFMYLNRGRHLLFPIVLVPVPLPLIVLVLDTASVITRPPIFQKILTYKKKETKRMMDIVALMGHATKLNTLALK